MDMIWEKIHATQEWGQYPAEHVIRFVARNYYKTDRKNVRILDFGMGGGAHTWYLAREGFDAYGFDGAPTAVKKVEERLKQQGFSAHLKCCDGVQTGYENAFFDAVIDNVCVDANSIADIECMYAEIFRILKTGGKLLTVCFDKKTTGYGTGTLVEPDTYTDMTEGIFVKSGLHHFFGREDLNALLLKTGFRNLRQESLVYTDRGSVISELITIAEK